MNGLLGDDIDPRTQGLLALGLGLMQGRGNFGQAFGAAGQQALSAYQGAQDRDKRKRLQEQQERTLAHQQSVAEWQHEQARKQAEEAAQNQAWIRSMPGPQMQASSAALESGGGPTMANAAKVKQVTPQQELMWGMVQRGLMTPQAYMEATRQKAPEVKAFKPGEVFGTVDGGRFNELGRVPDKEDTPSSLREFRAAQQDPDYARHLLKLREAGGTNLSVAYGSPVAGVDAKGNPVFIQPTKDGSPPMVVPGVRPPKSATEERAEQDKKDRARQGEQMMSAMNDAERILTRGKATASGVGNIADAAARAAGITTGGAQDAARLEALSGWLVANVPRMEGPQSNFDVQNYITMAGKVGDRTTPIPERVAALREVRNLQKKYAAINGIPMPNDAAPAKPTSTRDAADAILRGQ